MLKILDYIKDLVAFYLIPELQDQTRGVKFLDESVKKALHIAKYFTLVEALCTIYFGHESQR